MVPNRFAVIDNPNRALQPPLLNSISFLSTCISFLFFYLIITIRHKEPKLYRMVFLIQYVSLWMAQLHWGTLHGYFPLFPFPGLYGIGYLTSFVSSYVLMIVWMVLFSTAVLMQYLILLVRLHSLARINGPFHFSNCTYSIFTAILAIFVYIPLIFAGFLPDHPIRKLAISCSPPTQMPSKFSTSELNFALCQLIVFEIRENCKNWSAQVEKYHRKALKDTVLQYLIFGVFLAIAPALQLFNGFRNPEEDTITSTILASAVFVAAPIPVSMMIIFQNTAYRRFVISKFKKLTKAGGGQCQIRIVPFGSPALPQRANIKMQSSVA